MHQENHAFAGMTALCTNKPFL